MIKKVEGFWYPKGNSQRFHGSLQIDSQADRFELQATPISGDQAAVGNALESRIGQWSSITVSSRMGNTPRKLGLPDGSLLETTDNDQIDNLLTGTSHSGTRGTVASRLERSWGVVIGSLLAVVVCGFLFFRFGLPAGASYVAHKLPVSTHEQISEGTLQSLDRFLFEESKLSAAEQNEQQESFQRLLEALPDNEHSFKLHIRQMYQVPNAFALPSGDIVITDALVQLAENQQEVESVMLHEIGHVIHRHGLQQVIQGSAITLIATLALGDLSGLGQLMAGVPVFLLQSSYSRKAELQADDYAFERMQAMQMDTIHFANFIERMGQYKPQTTEQQETPSTETQNDNQQPTTSPTDDSSGDEEQEFPEYLSSHPATSERAARARRLSNSTSQ